MFTIFALPKPFRGLNEIIQTNAIQSWKKLNIPCEIILFGDEEGTAEFAEACGIRHVPEIARNEYGTPLVHALFKAAQEMAQYGVICYINSDIILTGDFFKAIKLANELPSLIIGRRWDLDITDYLNIDEDPDWEKQLHHHLNEEGTLHGLTGIDYFIFPKGTYRDIPPFAIGRTAWDNWLIYKARSSGLPVIDATHVVTIVHQNHDFNHINTAPAGSPQLRRKGIEGEYNRKLLGGVRYGFGLLDATHFLTPTGLKSTIPRDIKYLFYRVLRLPEMHHRMIPLAQLVKLLRWLYFRAISVKKLLVRKKY